MHDPYAPLATFRRPAVLVRAARNAAEMNPRRPRLHARVLRGMQDHRGAAVIDLLRERETELNEMRLATDPAYAAQAHVEALAALLIELRDGLQGPAQAKASGSAALRRVT